jgi:hypothetical protein
MEVEDKLSGVPSEVIEEAHGNREDKEVRNETEQY